MIASRKKTLVVAFIVGMAQGPNFVYANGDQCAVATMKAEDKAVEETPDLAFLFADPSVQKLDKAKEEAVTGNLTGVEVVRVEVPNATNLVDADPIRRALNNKKAKDIVNYLLKTIEEGDEVKHQQATDQVLGFIHRSVGADSSGLMASKFLDEKIQGAMTADKIHKQATGDFKAFVSQIVLLSPDKSSLLKPTFGQKTKNAALGAAKIAASIVPVYGSKMKEELTKQQTTEEALLINYVENILTVRESIQLSIKTVSDRAGQLLEHIKTMKNDRVELIKMEQANLEQIAFLSELDNVIMEHIRANTSPTSPDRKFFSIEILPKIRQSIIELQMMSEALSQALTLNYSNVERNTDLVVRSEKTINRLVVILSTAAQQTVVMNSQRRQTEVLDFADQSAAAMLKSNAQMFASNGAQIRKTADNLKAIVADMKAAATEIANEVGAMESFKLASANKAAETIAELDQLLTKNKLFVQKLKLAEQARGSADQIVGVLNDSASHIQQNVKSVGDILKSFRGKEDPEPK